MLKWVVISLLVVLSVKLLWLAVELKMLPSTGVEQAEEVGGKPLYYRVELSSNRLRGEKRSTALFLKGQGIPMRHSARMARTTGLI